jgi:hypothetical protein
MECYQDKDPKKPTSIHRTIPACYTQAEALTQEILCVLREAYCAVRARLIYHSGSSPV